MGKLRNLLHIVDAAKKLLVDMGMARSIWKRESVLNGHTVPWLTLPAIHFLESYDWTNYSVVEFGSGASTNYWAERYYDGEIKNYLGYERNAAFYAKMCAEDNPFYQANVQCTENIAEHLRAVQSVQHLSSDVLVIVDGQMQDKALELSAALHAFTFFDRLPVLIVDDLNWLGPDAQVMLERNDYVIIPFAGFFPGTSFTKVTAVCLPPNFVGNMKMTYKVAGAIPPYIL